MIPSASFPAVLQVLPSLVSGGVERGTLEIAEALVAAGFRAFVASAGGPLVPALEALFATAIGLVAAIPAVLAYNKISTDLARFAGRMESFATEFAAILSRQSEVAANDKAAPAATAAE